MINWKNTLIFLTAITITFSANAGNQWVVGKLTKIQEYGGHSNNEYEVLLSLEEQSWSGTGDGTTVCTNRFRIKEGEVGVTSDIKNRMYSMLLASYMSGKRVSLYVTTGSAPYCNVIATGIGEQLP